MVNKNSIVTDDEWKKIDVKIDSLDERNSLAMAVRDLFALGCSLHLSGHKRTGRKAIVTALQSINLDKTNKTIFIKLVDHIPGNEAHYINRIRAHSEINDYMLFH
jgi:hypothetical protein